MSAGEIALVGPIGGALDDTPLGLAALALVGGTTFEQ
eukprot:SAG11_NODE_20599_length_442_cov_0.734694_2_plen_36_part_01